MPNNEEKTPGQGDSIEGKKAVSGRLSAVIG